MVVIRSVVDGDRAGIAALLKECGDASDSQIAPDDSSWERFSCSYVALNGDNIVGYGSIFSRWLHPQRLRIAIHVLPDSAQDQTNDALFNRLIAAIPNTDSRDLQASYWQSDEASADFWTRLGFSHLMRTRIGTLDPSSLPEEGIHGLPEGVSIGTGAELMVDRGTWDQIALLHEKVYRRNHWWNPPAPIGLQQARDLYLQPADLIPDALFVALRDDGPVAVASLRPGRRPGHCELGWTGEREPQAIAHIMTDILITRCFDYAREQKWLIDIEADDADPILGAIADSHELTELRSILAVIRRRNPESSAIE